MEVKINREIRNYTESMFFGLSLRQFVFSLLAVGVAMLLYCDVTRSVSKMTEIEGRGGKRWDKPKKAGKSRDCGGGKF